MPLPWNVVPCGDELHVDGPNGESLVVRGSGPAEASFLADWVALTLNKACGALPEEHIPEETPPIVGYSLAATAAAIATIDLHMPEADVSAPSVKIENAGTTGMPSSDVDPDAGDIDF